MPGVSVAGVTLEMDAAKLRELADRLHHAQTIGDRTVAAADAVIELRRLADGFDMLRAAATQERDAAAAAVRRWTEVCDCAFCKAARGDQEDETPRLNS